MTYYLGQLEHEAAVSQLTKIWLDHSRLQVQQAAGQALLNLATPAALQALEQRPGDPDPLSATLAVLSVFVQDPQQAFDRLAPNAVTIQATTTLSETGASANAARALLGACAELPGCGLAWLLDPEEKESEQKLRLVGYGQVNFDRVVAALRNDVCLLAADTLREDHWHLYTVTVPPSFITEKGRRGMSVALAIDGVTHFQGPGAAGFGF